MAPECFIFTLTNIHNTEPIKFPSVKKESVYHYKDNGPIFGNGADLKCGDVKGDFTLQNSNYAYFPYTYQDILGKGKSIFTGDLNNNNMYFKIKEIEAFQLLN